jgi:uncharacterized protein (DUF2252 family)
MTDRSPPRSGRAFGLDVAVARLTPAERAERGKAARSALPREGHAVFDPPADRADPVGLLERQAASRLPDLVPVRYGRMLTSPFSYFRGAALPMAADLAATPVSGLAVQACGDAHLSNFGLYASPERALVFDLNDFDETLPGPWEWDVKRLVASAAVAARERGWPRREREAIVREAAAGYREAMRDFARMTTLGTWYARAGERRLAGAVLERGGPEDLARFERRVAKARRKDSTRAFTKLTHRVDGQPRIAADPPLIVPIGELLPEDQLPDFDARMAGLIAAYRATLPAYRRGLVDRFRCVDVAHKVVGVGSVGTRAWILLLLGRDDEDPLFLQCKEAQPSVLAPHAGASRFGNQGRRVVEGQRLMQAASDIFLGWVRAAGIDGRTRDFYVRQLWDLKVSAELEEMGPDGMAAYAGVCAWTLARAHARSGDAIAIAAYLGGGDAADRALAEFGEAYAEQNERDHAALLDAIASGRVAAETGV